MAFGTLLPIPIALVYTPDSVPVRQLSQCFFAGTPGEVPLRSIEQVHYSPVVEKIGYTYYYLNRENPAKVELVGARQPRARAALCVRQEWSLS